MWGLKIAGMLVTDFVAQHIVWLLPIGLIVFAIISPSAALGLFRFLTRTLAGQILSAVVVAAVCAWFARGYVDGAAERTRAVLAERAAAKAAEDRQKQVEAQLAELRRQVVAADKLAADARDRDLANEAALESYKQREDAYEAAIATQPALGDALSDADVRSLRAAADAYRASLAAGSAVGAGKLRPLGGYP